MLQCGDLLVSPNHGLSAMSASPMCEACEQEGSTGYKPSLKSKSSGFTDQQILCLALRARNDLVMTQDEAVPC